MYCPASTRPKQLPDLEIIIPAYVPVFTSLIDLSKLLFEKRCVVETGEAQLQRIGESSIHSVRALNFLAQLGEICSDRDNKTVSMGQYCAS